jgi:hypothetical protein
MKPRKKRNKKIVGPRSLEEYLALREQDQDLWDDVGQIVTEVKHGGSLHQTSKKFRRDPRLIQRLARSALRKRRNGRWAAKKRDSLLRVLPVPTNKGLVEIGIVDSQLASLLGKYWSVVERYQDTGDTSGLRDFAGKHVVDASGNEFPLLTDLQELDRLGSAGAFSFESLYGKVA